MRIDQRPEVTTNVFKTQLPIVETVKEIHTFVYFVILFKNAPPDMLRSLLLYYSIRFGEVSADRGCKVARTLTFVKPDEAHSNKLVVRDTRHFGEHSFTADVARVGENLRLPRVDVRQGNDSMQDHACARGSGIKYDGGDMSKTMSKTATRVIGHRAAVVAAVAATWAPSRRPQPLTETGCNLVVAVPTSRSYLQQL